MGQVCPRVIGQPSSSAGDHVCEAFGFGRRQDRQAAYQQVRQPAMNACAMGDVDQRRRGRFAGEPLIFNGPQIVAVIRGASASLRSTQGRTGRDLDKAVVKLTAALARFHHGGRQYVVVARHQG
ncbi:hypothetical protein AAFN86_25770 [Roseomonas sp. CAU 1739]